MRTLKVNNSATKPCSIKIKRLKNTVKYYTKSKKNVSLEVQKIPDSFLNLINDNSENSISKNEHNTKNTDITLKAKYNIKQKIRIKLRNIDIGGDSKHLYNKDESSNDHLVEDNTEVSQNKIKISSNTTEIEIEQKEKCKSTSNRATSNVNNSATKPCFIKIKRVKNTTKYYSKSKKNISLEVQTFPDILPDLIDFKSKNSIPKNECSNIFPEKLIELNNKNSDTALKAKYNIRKEVQIKLRNIEIGDSEHLYNKDESSPVKENIEVCTNIIQKPSKAIDQKEKHEENKLPKPSEKTDSLIENFNFIELNDENKKSIDNKNNNGTRKRKKKSKTSTGPNNENESDLTRKLLSIEEKLSPKNSEINNEKGILKNNEENQVKLSANIILSSNKAPVIKRKLRSQNLNNDKKNAITSDQNKVVKFPKTSIRNTRLNSKIKKLNLNDKDNTENNKISNVLPEVEKSNNIFASLEVHVNEDILNLEIIPPESKIQKATFFRDPRGKFEMPNINECEVRLGKNFQTKQSNENKKKEIHKNTRKVQQIYTTMEKETTGETKTDQGTNKTTEQINNLNKIDNKKIYKFPKLSLTTTKPVCPVDKGKEPIYSSTKDIINKNATKNSKNVSKLKRKTNSDVFSFELSQSSDTNEKDYAALNLIRQGRATIAKYKKGRGRLFVSKVKKAKNKRPVMENKKLKMISQKIMKNYENIEIDKSESNFNNHEFQVDNQFDDIPEMQSLKTNFKTPERSSVNGFSNLARKTMEKETIEHNNSLFDNIKNTKTNPNLSINGTHLTYKQKLLASVMEILNSNRSIDDSSKKSNNKESNTRKTNNDFSVKEIRPTVTSTPWRYDNQPISNKLSRCSFHMPSPSIPSFKNNCKNCFETSTISNISNIENLEPENKISSIETNPRKGLANRSPLKNINILEVIHLPPLSIENMNKVKQIQVIKTPDNKTITKSIQSRETCENIDPSINNENDKKLKKTIDCFGFEEDFIDDIDDNNSKSVILSTKKNLQRTLKKLKRSAENKPKINHTQSKPTRISSNALKVFYKSPIKQKDIREIFCSTMVEDSKNKIQESKKSLCMDGIEELPSELELGEKTTELHLFDDIKEQSTLNSTLALKTYSRPKKRRTLRHQYATFLDSSDEEDIEVEKNPRKKRKNPVQRKEKKELEKFIDNFNSLCDEVDKYDLIVE